MMGLLNCCPFGESENPTPAPKGASLVTGCTEIGVAVLKAPAGIITSNRPSGDISEPPAASIVAADGVPIAVPIGVGVPDELFPGDVGLAVLQDTINMLAQIAARTRRDVLIMEYFHWKQYDNGIVTEIIDEGRQQNRRVEFTIIKS